MHHVDVGLQAEGDVELFYQPKKIFPSIAHCIALAVIFASLGLAQDLIPPSGPLGLTATAVSCGQVDLSWNASVDNTGGSGMKAYIIGRSDGVNTTIGSTRTTFSDTNY